MDKLSPAAAQFLEAPRFAVVAVTGPAGLPQQAVTWFRLTPLGIQVNARHDRHWAASARRTGHLSVTVADGYDYVMVRGRCTADSDRERALEDIRALARRYGEDDGQFDGQRRVTFTVEPELVLVHGGPAADRAC